MSPSMLALLYDPASYYRPWYRSMQVVTACQRSALNGYLISQFGLPGYSAVSASQQAAVDRLVRSWHLLPAAAYLVACAKHRQRVMADRSYVLQSRAVHAFLRLGFEQCAASTLTRVGTDELLAWGGQYLRFGLAACLPGWMSARMPLLFADSMEQVRSSQDHTDDFDPNCFWSALAYAANDPEFSASLCP